MCPNQNNSVRSAHNSCLGKVRALVIRRFFQSSPVLFDPSMRKSELISMGISDCNNSKVWAEFSLFRYKQSALHLPLLKEITGTQRPFVDG